MFWPNCGKRLTGEAALRTLIIVMAIGVLGIVLYALQASSLAEFASIAGVGTIIAGASLLAGGLLGFLFGIPRTLQEDRSSELAPTGEQPSRLPGQALELPYRANTNLEQISDWLTKVLVGVGLTQLTVLPGRLQQIADLLAPGVGGFDSSRTFALAILIYFPVCGFLFGFLWTRLFLAGMLVEADVRLRKFQTSQREVVSEYLVTIDALESRLDEKRKQEVQPEVQEFRQKAERQLASLTPLGMQAHQLLIQYARDYERVRKTMRPGSERTLRMGAILAQVRSVATQAALGPEEVSSLFATGMEGDRIVTLGLLQATPYPACFGVALEAIRRSKSAFEQYHGLRVAEEMLPSLNTEQKRQLVEVVEHQRSGEPETWIEKGTDRWYISERILAAVEQKGDS